LTTTNKSLTCIRKLRALVSVSLYLKPLLANSALTVNLMKGLLLKMLTNEQIDIGPPRLIAAWRAHLQTD
jgi:hypothetical protein